jgi:ribonuclease J
MVYRNTNTRNSRANYKRSSNSSYARGRKNPMLEFAENRRKREPAKKGDKPIIKSRPVREVVKKDSVKRTERVSLAKPIRIKKKPVTAYDRKRRAPRYKGHNKQPLAQKQMQTEDGMLRIIPLGGCEEVGRNMTIFEFIKKGNEKNKDIIILDMGLQFPEEDMPGIDYIIPNVEYLKGLEKNIRAVVFSHGHLDHIGAAPILLEKLGNPMIIGRDLTIEMIKHRVEDYKKGTSKNLKTSYIKDIKDNIRFGEMNLKFFAVEHSIKDAIGMVLETPAGTVVHPGDWTMENDPEGRPMVDYTHLANLKTPTVLMLEALAAGNREGSKKVTEAEMFANLTKLINEAPGRIIIGTFASQVERIKQIIDISASRGKKVALDGFSMKMNMKLAAQLGYVKIKQGSMIDIKNISKYPDNKIVILATGAQGESNAVLSRIVNNNHKSIRISKTDTIVFSSSVIPGNERTIQRLKDNLYRLSDNIIHSDIMDVHVSGHATLTEVKLMVKQIQPTYLIPVYANHYMLKEAAIEVAKDGFDRNKIFVPDNGSVIEFPVNKKPRVNSKKVNTDYVFVDGLGVGDVSNIVLRDRQMMSEDGMMIVIVTVNKKTGRLLTSPDLISRGFIYMKENKGMMEETRRKVRDILKNTDPKIEAFPDYIKNKIRNEVGQFLFKKTERRPMVLPVVIAV